MLGAFGPQDLRVARAFGFQHLGAFLALGFHLAGHRIDEVARRLDVLDLDAGDLDAPRMHGLVDDAQQPVVYRIAVGK